jgi:RNA polymerase sigma factor (sigma-70 family)
MPYDADTAIGGPRDRFPSTRHSLLAVVQAADSPARRQALDDLIAVYWKPVYKHVRGKWRASNEEAKDLTQAFFAALLDRNLIARFDPSRASFRTYLRVCLDGFVAHEREAGRRLKRGGGTVALSLDFAAAEREWEAADPGAAPDEIFEREWQRQLFALALADLAAECAAEKPAHYAVFAAYDLTDGERPSYDELAQRFQLPATQITNYLAWARRRLRQLVLARLTTVTTSPEEQRREERLLLRARP